MRNPQKKKKKKKKNKKKKKVLSAYFLQILVPIKGFTISSYTQTPYLPVTLSAAI